MAVILFYTPFIRRSRDVESLILRFHANGHKVIFLTIGTGEDICPFLQSHGIDVYIHNLGDKAQWLYHLRHLIYFIRFCFKNKVTTVFSHLDTPNFIASLGQYFVRARVFLCRHHIDEAALYNYHHSFTYRMTNFLAKSIIVVSEQSKRYMIEVENVAPEKLIHINLAYDFSLYKQPDSEEVRAIRNRMGNALLLITICRLTKFKRPQLSIHVLEKLRENGCDAHLLILGSGDMMNELRKYISDSELTNWVSLEGQVKNIMDYLEAADFLLHPSVLESSCVVVKEAGLLYKPVIVCKGIGDFDDYLRHGENGFMVDANNFVSEAAGILKAYSNDAGLKKAVGSNLHRDIHRLFDIDAIEAQYQPLLKNQKRTQTKKL